MSELIRLKLHNKYKLFCTSSIRICAHFEYLHCAGSPPFEFKRKTRGTRFSDLCVCVSVCAYLDGGSIIGLSPHPAGEQLWGGWSGEAEVLD